MNHVFLKTQVLTLLLFFFFGISALQAQQKKWIPAFKLNFRDYLKLHTSRDDVSYFLQWAGISSNEGSPQCETRYGEFKFRVNYEGLVDSIQVMGNLPDSYNQRIVTRIRETAGRWTVPTDSSPQNECWFTYPFYMFIRENYSGCPNRGYASQQNHFANYKLLLSLPYSDQGILSTTTSVLIRPGHSEPSAIK
ncbi:hypothetical protein [Siphonobacter sp. SORGH_AS_0500]|uniref:hypothetical protein n=1 Tax=Siphonobacter sp. SORGH_AS_0500 TaxID=1864824 RepID=UPI002866780B|nr:hypothetical protein [Siphonobacter sp. SORGH_AS_0500]MDR6196857.1 hypothetical protein [Siphonobacter sp. SORGH_AS_0500]